MGGCQRGGKIQNRVLAGFRVQETQAYTAGKGRNNPDRAPHCLNFRTLGPINLHRYSIVAPELVRIIVGKLRAHSGPGTKGFK